MKPENDLESAARALIAAVQRAERDEGLRSRRATLSFEVELSAGGVETWEITIERTASTH